MAEDVPPHSSVHSIKNIFSGGSRPSPTVQSVGIHATPTKSMASHETNKDHDKWISAISSLDTSSLVKLMIDEVAKIPYKKKRDLGATGDHEVVQVLLEQMTDLLGNNFLHIDFKSSARNVNNTDWSKITSCRRSDSGTTGIYFIQSAIGSTTPSNRSKSPARSQALLESSSSSTVSMDGSPSSEIIVAKPVSKEDFERHLFVNEMIKEYFKIHCPAIRFISKNDDEFKYLEESVKKLFMPFHQDLYDLGGQGSPKALFQSHAIMLMELVKGKPLCHRTEGQRMLKDEDFRAIGRMYLLDLLIRNTDRLPSRKAIPRPASINISDHGNAGNLMFGDLPGSLWAIDPEMQTNIDITRESEYLRSLESILYEIINDEISMTRYKALDALFFCPNPGLSGILDVSLEELTPWAQASVIQQDAIASILSMIRVRAHAEDNAIIIRAGGVLPPESNNEREWREWIRFAAPRAVIDVLKFIEVYSGYKCPPTAAAKFEQGFLEALSGAIDFQRETRSPFGSMAVKRQALFRIIVESGQIDVGFVRRMIDGLAKVCPILPYPSPQTECDDEKSIDKRFSTSISKKKLMSAVRTISSSSVSSNGSSNRSAILNSTGSGKDFSTAHAEFITTLASEEVSDLPSPEMRRSASGRRSAKTSPPLQPS